MDINPEYIAPEMYVLLCLYICIMLMCLSLIFVIAKILKQIINWMNKRGR